MRSSGLKQTCTYVARTRLGERRVGFELLRFNRRLRSRLVGANTDVCIEGFPRSANSLAVHAFRIANPGAQIAHHVHVPMQVVRAVELGVPCAVLIREPIDAIVSLLIMSEGNLPQSIATRSYESFYRRIARVRERVLLVRFPDLISDPFVIARRLNQQFGAGFDVPPIRGDSRERALESVRRANLQDERRRTAFTMPAAEKDDLKPRLADQLRSTRRLADLQSLHNALVGDTARNG